MSGGRRRVEDENEYGNGDDDDRLSLMRIEY